MAGRSPIKNIRTIQARRGEKLVIDLGKTYTGILKAWMKRTPDSPSHREFNIVENRYIEMPYAKTLDYYDDVYQDQLLEDIGGRWAFDIKNDIASNGVFTTIVEGTINWNLDVTNTLSGEYASGDSLLKVINLITIVHKSYKL